MDRSASLAFVACAHDVVWLLDDAEQRELLTLPPSAFDNDRGVWGIVRAQTYALRGDQA